MTPLEHPLPMTDKTMANEVSTIRLVAHRKHQARACEALFRLARCCFFRVLRPCESTQAKYRIVEHETPRQTGGKHGKTSVLTQKSLARSRPAKGIVLILMLLAIVLIAALLFYVLNLGKHVNGRIVTQHSADAAAMGGATWTARTLNAVAMNNITTARYLAAVNVLDSLPTVTQATLNEQSAYLEGIEPSLGQASFSNTRLNSIIESELALLRDELLEEVALLEPVDAMFDREDITQTTHYPGSLWEAMAATTQISVSMMQALPDLPQQHGQEVGLANLVADGARGPFVALLPLQVSLPFRYGQHPNTALRTHLDDFENPVKTGRLPDWQDHPVVNRGPFDTVFGWRSLASLRDPSGTGSIPGQSATDGINSNVTGSFGGRPSNDPTQRTSPGSPDSYPIAYRTWGTLSGVIGIISEFAERSRRTSDGQRRGNLRSNLTRYVTWLSATAYAKLNYLWPELGETQPNQFSMPQWNTTYPTGVEEREDPIPETAYFRMDIKSRYHWDDALFMASEDSWNFENRVLWDSDEDPLQTHFVLRRPPRWWAMAGPVAVDYPHQLSEPGIDIRNIDGNRNRMWLYAYPYTVLSDTSIGIEPTFDADGNAIPQDVYFVQILVFAAINENPVAAGPFSSAYETDADHPQTVAVAITNPYELLNDQNREDLPAPVLLDTGDFNRLDLIGETLEIREQIRQFTKDRLTVLACARRSSRAMLWPTQFDRTRPGNRTYATAQAIVFNRHSFDLWTPMWQAQLEHVDPLDGWVNVAADASEGDPGPHVDSEDLADLAAYLAAIEPLAEISLSH